MVHDETPESPVSPGEIVAGKYRVERVLGVGGMGVVVSARHTTLDQIVAIKFLVVNRYATQEEAVARFLAEARAAASIHSDYVCRVFDVGTLDDGVPFMVMEHLEGRDLDEEIVLRGQLPLVEAVDYVLQAADALAAAHQRGIVHRDIKPANLFLATRPDGTRRVKVLDFGVSKTGTESEASSSSRARREIASLGTPAYMSPEQVRGSADVDVRTDIWGLGVILYELVTGQMAFVGKDVTAILDHVLEEDPCPMHLLRRDVPAELESIVMRCLDRNRNARWPSAARFAAALAPSGSIGIFSQLASVQRELGSMASIHVSSAHSVQPVVATVRPSLITLPDPESQARESIVDEWTKLRARKRTTRLAFVGMASLTFLVAAAAILLRVTADKAPASGAIAPPMAVGSIPTGSGVGTESDGGSMYPAPTSVQSASEVPAAARP